MRVFEIFDKWGNLVGEIHTANGSGDGLGEALTAIGAILLGLAIIVIWPVFFMQLFAAYGGEWVGQTLFLLMLLAVHFVCILQDCKKDIFYFGDSWRKNVISNILITGLGYWLILSLIEGFFFWSLLALLFITFLLSVSSSFLAALLTMLIRWIRKKRANA